MSLSKKKTVAYFCAEFGIDSNLPTYAGGLGILAGDTLLEAGDEGYPLIGIGLLYQGKTFVQRFDKEGWQYEEPSLFNPESTACLRPVEKDGKPIRVSMDFLGNKIFIKAFKQRLGDNTTLYLLTTDTHDNPEDWREVMNSEYCCGDESQLRQQLILSIGGVRFLKELKIEPDIYHFQEGRPIFVHWELLKDVKKSKKNDFNIVYTNHTLVPDGNLVYDANLVRRYADDFAGQTGISVTELVAPGLVDDGNGFSITKYALGVSKIVSGVSEVHTKLSKSLWPEKNWVNITNGIYLPRWQKYDFKNPKIKDRDLWQAHLGHKESLARVVKRRSGFSYDHNRLVIGWARRITAYKQVQKIFEDIGRIKSVVTNSEHPIQILIAGKAHPGDNSGKETIQEAMKHMTNDLPDYALYVPNYDISLSRELVAGVDIWLNTPEFGKEACGTSGMKAASNGIVNLTIADGWAAEVNWAGAGFVLDHENISTSIYESLEEKIIPNFYDRSDGIPVKWLPLMRKSIEISKHYSTQRMLREYSEKLYK